MIVKYRVAPLGCAKGNWYQSDGKDFRDALHEAAKGCTVDGDPVRVEVDGHGFWWLSQSTEIRQNVHMEHTNSQ